MSEISGERFGERGLDRRAFLRKAAVVGTGAFVVPTIITMAPAGAEQITSPPPAPPAEIGGAATVGAEEITSPPSEPPPEEVGGAEPGGGQETTSPPPGPPTAEVGEAATVGQPPVEVAGVTISRQGAQVAGRSELPRTGLELDDLVVAGLAAAAGGAALVLWSADADT